MNAHFSTSTELVRRDTVEEIVAKRNLPAGSFASVGTYCNTVVLRVNKDGSFFYA